MKHCSKGFTLLELMVVVAIAGILAAIAWPNYTEWYSKTRLDNDARIVASDLQYAKISAVKENALVEMKVQTDGSISIKTFEIDKDGNMVIIKALKSRKLEYFVPENSQTVFFNTRGIPIKAANDKSYIISKITIKLKNENEDKRSISVNIAGNIQINN